jgi:hypothetical protein
LPEQRVVGAALGVGLNPAKPIRSQLETFLRAAKKQWDADRVRIAATARQARQNG